MDTVAEQSIAGFPCTVTGQDYRGWESIRLANGIIELFAVPQIGGRVMQLRIAASDFLYINRRHESRVYRPDQNNFEAGWKNYGGSKVWPAPQGWSSDAEWPGPPDPVLDGGVYSCEILEGRQETAAIRLESPPDEYTGLTFAREIRIFEGSATVDVQHTMRNTSARPVRWAMWQVTQQTATRDISIFVPTLACRQIYGDRAYGGVSFDSSKRLCHLRYANRVAKFAMMPEQGWLATLDSRRGVALVETFSLFPNSAYPDGAPVELWVNGQGSYTVHNDKVEMGKDPNGCDPFIETEVVSPLVELEPGEEYGFRTAWHGTSIQTDTIAGVNHCAVIGCRLTARRQGREVRITGSFGLLRAGQLESVSVLQNGSVGGVDILGQVSPLTACVLDSSVPWDQGFSRVSLRLKDKSGKLLGTVDEAIIS